MAAWTFHNGRRLIFTGKGFLTSPKNPAMWPARKILMAQGVSLVKAVLLYPPPPSLIGFSLSILIFSMHRLRGFLPWILLPPSICLHSWIAAALRGGALLSLSLRSGAVLPLPRPRLPCRCIQGRLERGLKLLSVCLGLLFLKGDLCCLLPCNEEPNC